MSLKIFAPAKVNLTLHVSPAIPKGQDFAGYHKLDSLVMFTGGIGDNLYLSESDEEGCRLDLKGEFAPLIAKESDNIIFKAHKIMESLGGKKLNVNITLEKNLPIASGIGGGSTDAAATLIGINQLFALGIAANRLADAAIKLGADVPICVKQQAMIMRGIGNEFCSAPSIPDINIILANPLFPVSTPLVYRKFDEFNAKEFNEFSYNDSANLNEFLKMLQATDNNLEAACFAQFPEVAALKQNMQKLDKVKFVRMSGSGGSVFAIFANDQDAENARQQLLKLYNNNIWAKCGKLLGNINNWA